MAFIQQQHYLSLPDTFYSYTCPKTFASPHIVKSNYALLSEYGVNFADVDKELLHALLHASVPTLSLAYAGHQFGHYSPQLGDGRAHLLGQLITPDGHPIDVQLKGTGRTPYSRQGDGLATLSSMLREYLISEALSGLGIPTTRTLAVICTGEEVLRHNQYQMGGIQVRTAKTHIRVGSFEYAYHTQGEAGVRALADFFIAQHFPKLANRETKYTEFLEVFALQQAEIIAHWMSVGFIHGVMNTDNMSLESIDFGPCAFLDEFNAMKHFNSIDREGRYAWGQQGQIGYWNLQRLAETLLPLIDSDEKKAIEIANEKLQAYIECYQTTLSDRFHAKFGLIKANMPDDFISASLQLLEKNHVDFHCFFSSLTQYASGIADESSVISWFHKKNNGEAWLEEWKQYRDTSDHTINMMKAHNPVFIPRNHCVEKALKLASENQDFDLFNRLCEAAKDPYTENHSRHILSLPPTKDERVLRTFCGT